MPDRDGYIPGVPSWVDTNHPDAEAILPFYGELFGWQFEDVMPEDAGGSYHMARIRGRDVAAIGGIPDGGPPMALWNTYIWVTSADDAAAKAREAGGTVLAEPFDVMTAGRMAVLADPEGAVFNVWEARDNQGAEVVNEHGALNFNGLATRDVERAKAFYGALFGWELLDLGGSGLMWTLPGYGDHLEENSPGLKEQVASMGGPDGFIDVVAMVNPIAEGDEHPPHWSVTFGVDDADAVAAKATELGGEIVAGPLDVPWVRMVVIKDPQGAVFIASQFVPENAP